MEHRIKILTSSLTGCKLLQYVGTYCFVCNTPITPDLTCVCAGSPTILKLPIKEEYEDYFFMDGSVRAIPVTIFHQPENLQL